MMSRKPMPPEKIIFPAQLMGTRYYQPVDRGLEIKIKEKLRHLQELDKGEK
jgi:putative ATPase